jgi:hypothetical protein
MGMLLVLYQSFDGFISQIYESSSIKMPDNRLASPMLAYALIVAIMLMSGFSCFNLFYLRKKIFIKSIDIVQVFK